MLAFGHEVSFRATGRTITLYDLLLDGFPIIIPADSWVCGGEIRIKNIARNHNCGLKKQLSIVREDVLRLLQEVDRNLRGSSLARRRYIGIFYDDKEKVNTYQKTLPLTGERLLLKVLRAPYATEIVLDAIDVTIIIARWLFIRGLDLVADVNFEINKQVLRLSFA